MCWRLFHARVQERKQCEPLLRPRYLPLKAPLVNWSLTKAVLEFGAVKRHSAVSKSTLRDARLLCCPCALSSTCICIHLYECMCACICVYMHTWMCVCVCARARLVKFTKQGDKKQSRGIKANSVHEHCTGPHFFFSSLASPPRRGARNNQNNMHPFHGNTKIWYQLPVKRLLKFRYLSQVRVRGAQNSALTRAFQ